LRALDAVGSDKRSYADSDQSEDTAIRLGMMYLRGKDFDQSKVIAPLAFGYLAAYLREYLGFEDVVLTIDDPVALLAQDPQVIGISSFTETFEDVIRHARWFKRMAPEVPILVGGEHISALPESLPPCVDVGILGEGEATLAELMALYVRHEATPETLARIPGLIFWHQGQQVKTAPRSWMSDLDLIPPPDRMLLHDTNPRWQQAIFTARGCPYQCTFCASTRFWQKTRYHSVERVINEIEYILRHFPQQPLIAINDDLFPLNRKRLRTMVEAIRARGIHRKVGFVLNARASVFDEEIARLIQAMNGQVVGFGFESASDHVLTAIKGKTSARENLRALELCEKYGLAVVGNFMSGGPDESREDMAKTWWFIQKNKHRIWHPSVGLATPFPGTEFWQRAETMGLIQPDFDRWNVLDLGFQPGVSIYMNPVVPEQEFVPIYDKFSRFQVRGEASREQFAQFQVKRAYLEQAFALFPSLTEAPASVLEINCEASSLATLFPTADYCTLAPTQGQLQLSSLQERRFDLIVLVHALEKVRDPQAMLIQLRALLSDRGQLLCLCYHAGHISLLLDLLKGHWHAQLFAVHHHQALRFFGAQNVLNVFESAGFNPERLTFLKFDDTRVRASARQLEPFLSQLLPGHEPPAHLESFSLLVSAHVGASQAPPHVSEQTLSALIREPLAGVSG
jgi:anaerobic magnesium-protoporphyrin IX monomethyl ester cyclase